MLGIALVALSEADVAYITASIGWFVLAYGGALGIVALRLRRLAAAERESPASRAPGAPARRRHSAVSVFSKNRTAPRVARKPTDSCRCIAPVLAASTPK